MKPTKHTGNGSCKCARCAAIASGKTPAQADAEQRDWTRTEMKKHGWICHFVAAGDEQSPTGFNAHTHGLQENYQHKDFQLVIPLPEKIAHSIFIELADRVKAGEMFVAGQKVDDIIQRMQVKLVDAVECGRPVLRVILPDKAGSRCRLPRAAWPCALMWAPPQFLGAGAELPPRRSRFRRRALACVDSIFGLRVDFPIRPANFLSG